LILILGCNSKKGIDCFRTTGTIIQEEFQVAAFTKITVLEGVQLILTQGDEASVLIETGENLIEEIEVKVENGTLLLQNNATCNLVRDYNKTKAFVTVTDIDEIRNASQYTIETRGPLVLNSLDLYSEDFGAEGEYYTIGDFDLDLQVENLRLVANNVSNFFLRGQAEKASFSLYAGVSRIEAGNFLVNNLTIFHRSTNKMIVHPLSKISGEIRGIGDVISKNRPPEIDVEIFYTGQLIFEE